MMPRMPRSPAATREAMSSITCPSLLPGGFLGVTLFFVVSGFLLTRSMVNLFERLRFSYPHRVW
mgnify:CR=1 FL=1